MSAPQSGSTTSLSEFGKDFWSYLTGQEAVIDYSFQDMSIDVPRTTGPDAETARWTLNGTLRITTSDKDHPGAAGSGA